MKPSQAIYETAKASHQIVGRDVDKIVAKKNDAIKKLATTAMYYKP